MITVDRHSGSVWAEDEPMSQCEAIALSDYRLRVRLAEGFNALLWACGVLREKADG